MTFILSSHHKPTRREQKIFSQQSLIRFLISEIDGVQAWGIFFLHETRYNREFLFFDFRANIWKSGKYFFEKCDVMWWCLLVRVTMLTGDWYEHQHTMRWPQPLHQNYQLPAPTAISDNIHECYISGQSIILTSLFDKVVSLLIEKVRFECYTQLIFYYRN